jgi:hypothetical protein
MIQGRYVPFGTTAFGTAFCVGSWEFKKIMPSCHTKSKVACRRAKAYRQRSGMRAIFFWYFSYEKEKYIEEFR